VFRSETSPCFRPCDLVTSSSLAISLMFSLVARKRTKEPVDIEMTSMARPASWTSTDSENEMPESEAETSTAFTMNTEVKKKGVFSYWKGKGSDRSD
jgi:hypothetical protein